MQRINSIDELRARIGNPHPLTKNKLYDHLFPAAQEFIQQSPLIMMATSNAEGQPTVSPKGDQPGFVAIENERVLLIPERPGNKLLHGLSNIIATGQIGIIFLIPGTEETLRVNGACQLYQGEELCGRFTANGKPALLVMQVEVKECFFHCAKAFKRSKTWDASSWPEPMKVSFGEQIAKNATKGKVSEFALRKIVDQAVQSDYKKNL